MKKWYCLLFGYPRGPFTDADMRHMAHRREITPETLVASDWVPEDPLDWKKLEDTELAEWVFPSVSEAAIAAGMKIAPIWRRTVSFLLDFISLCVPPFLSLFLDVMSMQLVIPGLSLSIASWVVVDFAVLAIHAFLLLICGQTMGKKVFGIRVVNSEGGWAAPWLIVMRGVPYFGLGFLYLLFGYPMMFGIAALSTFAVDSLMALRSDGRALHDIISSTIVITKR